MTTETEQYTPQLTKWQTQMLISQYEKGCTMCHMTRTLRLTKQTITEQAALMGLVHGSRAKEKKVRVISDIVIPKKEKKPRNQKEEYLPADRNKYLATGELRHRSGKEVRYE